MSAPLAHLVNKSEQELSRLIGRLESLCGSPSEDLRLISQIKSSAVKKISELGLDPHYVNCHEVTSALRHKLNDDMQLLSKAIIHAEIGLIDYLSKITDGEEVLCLKKSTAKQLLREHPPKKIMKSLGYRSVDSMLKRENINELFAAAPLIESSRWQAAFWAKHEKLTIADFEYRQIEFVQMPAERWRHLTPTTGLASCLLQLGVVAIWPHKSSSLIKLAPCFDAIRIIRLYHLAIKFEGFSPIFGRKVISLMDGKFHSPVCIESLPLPWSALASIYRSASPDSITQAFGPQWQPADFNVVSPAARLASIHPAFCWWAENDDLVTVVDGQKVSFNLTDVLIGSLKNCHSYSQGASHLFDSLISRYLHNGRHNFIATQLDKLPGALETIKISNINHDLQAELVQAEFA